jgi:hypothetical protein
MRYSEWRSWRWLTAAAATTFLVVGWSHELPSEEPRSCSVREEKRFASSDSKEIPSWGLGIAQGGASMRGAGLRICYDFQV